MNTIANFRLPIADLIAATFQNRQSSIANWQFFN